MKTPKGVISAFLCIVLALSMVPATGLAAFAKDANETASVQIGPSLAMAAQQPTSVAVSPTTMYLYSKTDTRQLTATVYPTNATNKSVTWSSSNTRVATVSSTGRVTPVASGYATITARTSNGKKATCGVTVNIPVPVQPTSVSVSPSSFTFTAKGQQYFLSYKVLPTNATNKTLTWSSSNTRVATVTSTGVVKAVANGTATITARTVNGKTGTFKATVSIPVPPTSVSVSPSTMYLYSTTDTRQLTATVYPTNATNKSVTWSSSNTRVATVSSTGRVTPVASGYATITARTSNGKTATCGVSVNIPVPVQPTSVSVWPTPITFNSKSETKQLTATVYPTNAADKSVSWSSSNTRVATVTSTGTVKPVANGTATITATTSNGKKGTCSVTVNILPQATSVSVWPSSINFKDIGVGTQLSATVSPSNASQSVTWTSANQAVAMVSPNGVVTSVGGGSTTVTATTANGKKATCWVFVTVPTSVSLSATTLTFSSTTMTEKQLTAKVYPSDASQTVTWSSSNTNVATVSRFGYVTAGSNGTAFITATTWNGKAASCKVTVNISVQPTRVAVWPSSITLYSKDEERSLNSIVYPSNASQAVTWSSSNPRVATVSSTGVVKAVASGTATITAKSVNGLPATCSVTVKISPIITA